MAWGSGSRHGGIGTMRRWFLRGQGGGQGLPPPLAEAQSVHPGLWVSRPMLPARTARTPRPQQSLPPALFRYPYGGISEILFSLPPFTLGKVVEIISKNKT
jgi:hypothetical protein